MSETAPEATQDGNDSGTTSTANDFKPITSQDELNRIIGERVKRTEAKFSDYGDLKAKASQLDALSAASESAQDKLNRRIAELEAKSAAAEVAALRARYATDVPEKQRILLTGTTDEELAAQRDAILSGNSDRQTGGNRVPAEGKTPQSKPSNSIAEFARGMFGDT